MSEEKIVPFIEHLVELRKRLVVIVIAIVIGMGVAWNFSNDLLHFIEKPLTGETYLTGIKKSVYAKVKERAPALYSHFNLDKDANTPQKQHVLNYSAPLEPFFMQCKISMLAGFVIVLPVVFYQVWLLVARFGIVTYQLLAPKRKYALLASAIVAAFHADLITMFVIMVPMYLMYEISVWVALIFGKKKVAIEDELPGQAA